MTSDRATDQLERLGTGSAALDAILGGGIPARSVVVVAGEPGAGKTVFALQLLFHLARHGRRSLYFTTLSEPALKLIRYTQLFSFFDPALVDETVVFADLGSILREQGPEAALAEVVARVERDEPDLVVVDSFKAFHDMAPEPARSRTLVYDLAVQMAGWGATTFLVGEYTPSDVSVLPEFAVADGIVRLSNERQELTAVRTMEVLKLRGADYATGRHFFEMGPNGIAFYPRVRAPEQAEGRGTASEQRASTGVEGLDALLRGGLPRTGATLVEGGTGIGKTLLGLHFLVEGARLGEPGILLTLEETPAQLRGVARGFGWDLAALEAEGLFHLTYASPVELSTDRFLNGARQRIEALGARRVVLDSLSSLSLGVPSARRFRELVYALCKHLRALGVTLLMTQEIPELLGSAQLTGHGISSIADNVVLLRYVEVGGQLGRAISVLKARGIAHSTELRRVEIGAGGLSVGAAFTEFRGVLTGLPTPVALDPA